MPRQTILIRLAAATERQLRRTIHRRGDVVRRIEAIVEAGLTELSHFTAVRRRTADTEITTTTVRLERDLVARLDAAARQLGATRAALLEAMIEAHLKAPRSSPPSPPAAKPGSRRLTAIHLDPALGERFRQQYVRYRGDVGRTVAQILTAGLAAIDRFQTVPRRHPRGRSQALMVILDVALLEQLTAAAKAIGASRAALLEAMIAARLNGEI